MNHDVNSSEMGDKENELLLHADMYVPRAQDWEAAVHLWFLFYFLCSIFFFFLRGVLDQKDLGPSLLNILEPSHILFSMG